MQPRSHYKIVIVGGGLAGLSCAKRLLIQAKERGIPVHITVLEARDRWGGRVHTMPSATNHNDEHSIPLDLGAAWIHGVDHNPLTHLASTFNLEVCRPVSETVQMLNAAGQPVNKTLDEHVNRLFDQLLDVAADDCWGNPEESASSSKPWQPTAVRWYAQTLRQSTNKLDIPLVPVPPHRESTDISLDWSIGRALVQKKLRAFEKLSVEGRSLLLWHVKNLEYALGANVSDLSMQYWDIDDRNAFDGDHVLFQRGFGSLVDALLHDLQTLAPTQFEGRLSCPVQKIEYGRKTTTAPIAAVAMSLQQHEQPLVPLSDTCCITLVNGETIDCDFVISAVPLGVLKQAVKAQTVEEPMADSSKENTIAFDPPLPFSKEDAIANMGFGLLNKLFLHFDRAFWRKGSTKDVVMFGNTSSVHPQHYMFTDVGNILSPTSNKEGAPAVLVSLISGRDAALSEILSEAEVVGQAMEVLRTIFAAAEVPNPAYFKLTHWGKDPYSRGSYTFLPPGTTDQDFTVLQSPLNQNGDSVTLSSVGETMRLFFCGEHTTALHPSLAHGAWLSGVRAAEQVVQTMAMEFGNTSISTNTDRWIPLSLYRHDNPQTNLSCHLCHHSGTTVREGTLLAFARGTRQVVVHNACAEWSPEVEVMEEQWKNVVPCVNRAQRFLCSLCERTGASIGCSNGACHAQYHFRCAEDTGWRFETQGKEFFCGRHRSGSDCVRVSLPYYKQQNPWVSHDLVCCLCKKIRGEMLAFQLSTPSWSTSQYAVAHTTCVRHSNLVDLELDRGSRLEFDYRKIGTLLESARLCSLCKNEGATIRCRHCNHCYHYECALSTKWKFRKKRSFCCPDHRTNQTNGTKPVARATVTSDSETPASFFQHALFFMNDSSHPQEDIPGNLDITSTRLEDINDDKEDDDTESSWTSDDESESDKSEGQEETEEALQRIAEDSNGDGASSQNLECSDILTVPEEEGQSHLCRLHRNSIGDLWNVDFTVTRRTGCASLLQIAAARTDPFDNLRDGDTVLAINGLRIGDAGFDTLDQILSRLGQEVDTLMEVQRKSW
jgi:lysine-specific histone demethylase 1